METLEKGGILMGRYEKYDDHLQANIPKLYVCAECGRPVVQWYHPFGYLFGCAKNKSHKGIVLEGKFVEPGAAVVVALAEEALKDPVVGPVIKKAISDQNKATKLALYGPEEE